MLATDIARAAILAGYKVTGLNHTQLDITNKKQVSEALDHHKPDLVFNTPGIGVDSCEQTPEAGYRLHTWAADVIAQGCRRIGSELVYVSTCGLFGDEKRFYSEYDPVQLKTNYARSKYLGEQASLRSCEKTFVIRPGWLFGGTQEHKRNFVYQRYIEAKEANVIRSASDKFGPPTYTLDLSKKILEVVETGQYGLYHITNSGEASRYDYVRHIVRACGLSTSVEPVDSSSFPRQAPVPDCELLDNQNLDNLDLERLRPWQEAISEYVGSLGLV